MIGEQQIVSDPGVAGRWTQAIRSCGVRVELDGFGRGASSMSLLATLPLDGVRLHPDLARSGGDDVPERALLAGVLELARKRGLSVTATGVQTEEEAVALRQAGVGRVQGEAVSPALGDEDWVHPHGSISASVLNHARSVADERL